MTKHLPFLPGPVNNGPWPTFQLDPATRQSIASGRSPRVNVVPQAPPISTPGGSSSQNGPVREYDPEKGISYHKQPVLVRPVGQPGGVNRKPIREIGPQ
jgi:hypothetical protein